ncbi:hypothetical protein AVEN_52833-1, partial [Araneus ventricosus]
LSSLEKCPSFVSCHPSRSVLLVSFVIPEKCPPSEVSSLRSVPPSVSFVIPRVGIPPSVKPLSSLEKCLSLLLVLSSLRSVLLLSSFVIPREGPSFCKFCLSPEKVPPVFYYPSEKGPPSVCLSSLEKVSFCPPPVFLSSERSLWVPAIPEKCPPSPFVKAIPRESVLLCRCLSSSRSPSLWGFIIPQNPREGPPSASFVIPREGPPF